MRAEDLLFSDMSYELLQRSTVGGGVPLEDLPPSVMPIVSRLEQLGLAKIAGGRFVASVRGRLVCLAESEEFGGGIGVRVRAVALWSEKLARWWAEGGAR